ncbi:T9SS type A sorting domain-containing protein [uncultured Aquimarina sp.]|uniref:T9SS type A sorting domain-containing protein n=1 Tax=uncultured Aquimarina sp. TaxID=575652 RepID=UPI00261501DE|nr:T9SS type A sorting domain-containing protein [uncultured Aquimarina sp.]
MKTKKQLLLYLLLCVLFVSTALAQSEVRVLSPRNDIPKSTVYKVFVSTSENGNYKEAHVHHTFSNNDLPGYTGLRSMKGYKMGYSNFEFRGGSVWIKIVKINTDIPNLEVRPSKKRAIVKYLTEEGNRVAKIKIQAPTTAYRKTAYLSVVPLSAGKPQLDNALGIFANPYVIEPISNLVNVQPGSVIPKAIDLRAGQTVVFKPGVHNIGTNYPAKSGVNYYFSNGAFVKGTFKKNETYDNIKIYGLGIIAGGHLPRFKNSIKQEQSVLRWSDCNNIKVEDITIEDPSHHSITLGDGKSIMNEVRRVKMLTWRANGDGIHVSGKALVQDCFARTQDDGYYVASFMTDVLIERVSAWNDGNGSNFVFTYAGGGGNCVARDCDILYHRGNPGNTAGGNVIDLQGLLPTAVIENVLLEDFRVEDTGLNKRLFDFKMQPNNGGNGQPLTTAKFRNITFKNWTVAANGGMQSRLKGYSNTIFPENITFDCVTIAGEELKNFNGWGTENLKLSEIKFIGCDNQTGEDDLSSITASTNLQSGQSYEVKLDYIASEDRNIGIRLQDDKVTPVVNYGLTTIAVTEGSSTATATVTVDSSIPQNVGELRWFAFMVPKGGTWDDRLDTIEQTGVTVAADNPDGDTDNITSNYWRLENKATGQWVQPKDCASASGTRLIIVPTANTGDCTMFQFQETVNDHYFIINKATNGRLKFQSDSDLADDSIPVILVGSEFTGPHPQWQLIDAGDGYYRIQNRVTGNWIRSQACVADENTLITQVSKAFTGDCTKWKLVNAGTITNNESDISRVDNSYKNASITVYPNPANDQIKLRFQTSLEKIHSMRIYDLQGRVVKKIIGNELETNSNDIMINTDTITEGLYILSVDYNKKETQSIQFVIKH